MSPVMQSLANRCKHFIAPILSVLMDFYVGVFVRIFTCVTLEYWSLFIWKWIRVSLLALSAFFSVCWIFLRNCKCLMWKINLICSSASEMKNTPLKLSDVYQCANCDSYHLQSLGRTTAKVFVLVELFHFIYIFCRWQSFIAFCGCPLTLQE